MMFCATKVTLIYIFYQWQVSYTLVKEKFMVENIYDEKIVAKFFGLSRLQMKLFNAEDFLL